MARDHGGAPDGPLRRRVYYVAGFDPASPKKYHRLYTEQSALQGAVTGARYQVGELGQLDETTSGWRIDAVQPDGSSVEVDYRFLHWFEAVRGAWPKDEPKLFVGFAGSLIAYYRCGLMRLAKSHARAAWIASLSPSLFAGGFLLLFALVVGLLSWAGAALAGRLGAPWILGAAPPWLLWLLLMPAWKRFDAVLPVGWLGRGMIGVVGAAKGQFPDFAARAQAFAGKLVEAAREGGFDELLVVSHSMGGQQACRAVGRAVLLDPEFGRRTPVRLLTLGSLMPFYSMTEALYRTDPAYREEMAALVGADWIDWVDVTGPSDPGCAAALHPLTGLDLGEPEGRPHRRSPRYSELLTPASFERLKKTPLAYHFQYIMASEKAAEYDFFRLTAGPGSIMSIASPPTP
jgi:hypothetical protein